MICRRTGKRVEPNTICNRFWKKAYTPTTDLRNGCWCCNHKEEE